LQPWQSQRSAATEQDKCFAHGNEDAPPVPHAIVDDPPFHFALAPHEIRAGAIHGVSVRFFVGHRSRFFCG
jgi:hypothetical protein